MGNSSGTFSTNPVKGINIDDLDSDILQQLEISFARLATKENPPVLKKKLFIEVVTGNDPDTEVLAMRLFRSIDISNNGALLFKDYATAVKILQFSSNQERLALLMALYGTDGRKSLHLDRKGIRDLQLDIIAADRPTSLPSTGDINIGITPSMQGLVDAMVVTTLLRFDSDGDDKLSMNELMVYAESESRGVQALLNLLNLMGSRLMLPQSSSATQENNANLI